MKKGYMESYYPYRMTFQWHVTDRCNRHCIHCYQESFTNAGLNNQQLDAILEKLIRFTDDAGIFNRTPIKAHINLTGGEPFVKDELYGLIEKISESGRFSYGILTNGYISGKEQIRFLKKHKPAFVQLSLEGNKVMNDSIRGPLSYRDVQDALRVYKSLRIPVLISFTANKMNYRSFHDVVKFATTNGLRKVWTDRYIPGCTNDKLMLTAQEAGEYLESIAREKQRFRIRRKTEISSNRALQFIHSGGKPYKCTAGDTLLAILPNGDLLPCRRMPIVVGNILNDELDKIYQANELLLKLRNSNQLDAACGNCYYKDSCNGGLKCLSYAVYGDPFKKDPHCTIG